MDILSLPIDIDYSKTDSKYRMVIYAAQRARQLAEGSRPLVSSRYTKPTTLAIQEVIEEKLEVLFGKEAIIAESEARQLREENRRRTLLAERQEALVREIKNDLNQFFDNTTKSKESPLDDFVAEPPSEPEHSMEETDGDD